MEFSRSVGEDEIIKMNLALAERSDFTAADMDALGDDIRAELIDGQIFYFASPKPVHQMFTGEIYRMLANYIEKKGGDCEVFVAPMDVYLNCDDRTRVEPDVTVFCDREQIHEDACYGPPDLAVEVISKSTRKRDYGIKMLKYRTAGVKEYWIVEPEQRNVTVYWFEDETLNCQYSFDEEIGFHLFPDLKVTMGELVKTGRRGGKPGEADVRGMGRCPDLL